MEVPPFALETGGGREALGQESASDLVGATWSVWSWYAKEWTCTLDMLSLWEVEYLAMREIVFDIV